MARVSFHFVMPALRMGFAPRYISISTATRWPMLFICIPGDINHIGADTEALSSSPNIEISLEMVGEASMMSAPSRVAFSQPSRGGACTR